MRIFGWVLGGLYLLDGISSLVMKRDAMKAVHSTVGRKLPRPVFKTLKRATDVNGTAMRAMGVHNVLAGAGMLLLSTLMGEHKHHRPLWKLG